MSTNDAMKIKHLSEALGWCVRQLDDVAKAEMQKEKGKEFVLYRYNSAANGELVLREVQAEGELQSVRINCIRRDIVTVSKTR